MNSIERLHNLEDLLTHPGWLDYETTIRDAVIQAALNLADNKPITIEQLHTQRGALWAGKQLIEVVPILIQQLKNEVLLEQAKFDHDHPSA